MLSGVVKTQAEAAGIALFVILFPSNALAVWEYYKRGKIDIMLGIIVTIAYILLSGYGAKINALVPENTTLTANAVLQFVTGIILFIWLLIINYCYYNSVGSNYIYNILHCSSCLSKQDFFRYFQF